MRCLSVAQPWCWAIFAGSKLIENRTWWTRHRGRLAIHASTRLAGGWHDVSRPDGIVLPAIEDLPRGAILGTVELLDCVRVEYLSPELRRDPYAQGPFCWLLADPRPLDKPIPCKGRLGLWDVTLPPARTHVVNVRHAPAGSYIYVGRAMRRHKNPSIRRGSIWGNPFRDGSSEEVLKKYREHVLASPGLVALLPTLRGNVLGCWCAPNRCHADILADLADGPLGEPPPSSCTPPCQ